MSSLSAALEVLSSSSLRHDDVVSMRAGFAAQQAAAESRRAAGASSAPAPESQAAAPADETRTEAEPAAAGPATADTADAAPAPAPAPAPASVTSPRKFGSDEPEVNTRADAKEWRRWATEHSKAYADTVHPRLVRKGKPPVKLPLRAKPNDVINSVGIAPALYLDFLKLCAGYCAVGALFSVPSYLSSYAHASEVYDRNTTSLYPTSLLVLSVAARAECATEGCKQINLLASILEVVLSTLLLLGVTAFRRRARKLAAVNEANNVYTREYAVQLHGMPRDATAREVADHVEAILTGVAGLDEAAAKVWDVSLILNSATVLRQALRQAPLERKFSTLMRRLQIKEAFQRERNSGWQLTQRIAELRDDAREVGAKLQRVRDKIGGKGFHECRTVCGAFVTFEEQPAAQALRKLYGGGVYSYLTQKPALRLRGRKLKAYAATQPRDVLHENLPYRILAFDRRGFGTLVRRLVSLSILTACMALSFGAIVIVNSVKDEPLAWLSMLGLVGSGAAEESGSGGFDGSGEASASVETLDPSVMTLIDAVAPMAASLVVVSVNVGLSTLVGCLGEFERHPTLSGMHEAKTNAIFLSQAFNTGFLPLFVSMAPPRQSASLAQQDASCECANPLFCCTFGKKGFFLRGDHLTLNATWQKDVGTILTSSLIIQTAVALITWAVPGCLHRLKRVLKRSGVTHVIDMEALYHGPPIDLPKFVGKAYAFAWVTLMYAGALPILYAVGVVFFAGVWAAERYALLRVHSTPPPYSFELIHDTLWWMPWAVCTHLVFAFWSFASVQTWVMGGRDWVRPLLPGSNATAMTLSDLNTGRTSASVINALTHVYDLPGHVNSYATLILFAPAAALLLVLVLLVFRASPLYFPLLPIEAAVKQALQCISTGLLPCESKTRARVSAANGSFSNVTVVDPPFSQILAGVERKNVRSLKGRLLHEHQLKLSPRRSLLSQLGRYTPTALLFRLLGLYLQRPPPVSRADWKRAKPVFTQLTRAADISYQPEFHPTYEKAFVFLAEPERLQAFLASEQSGARGNANSPSKGVSTAVGVAAGAAVVGTATLPPPRPAPRVRPQTPVVAVDPNAGDDLKVDDVDEDYEDAESDGVDL